MTETTFENIVKKGDIAHREQYILLPLCFLKYSEIFRKIKLIYKPLLTCEPLQQTFRITVTKKKLLSISIFYGQLAMIPVHTAPRGITRVHTVQRCGTQVHSV